MFGDDVWRVVQWIMVLALILSCTGCAALVFIAYDFFVRA